jgi:hypothetical protein
MPKISIPRPSGFDIYDVLYVEDLPGVAVPLCPNYIASVPANSYADSMTYIRELWTRDNELWVADYEFPVPLFLGLGVGGVENRWFRGFRNISPLFLPPKGRYVAYASIAAGGSASNIVGALSQNNQHVDFIVDRIIAANTGTAAGTLTLTDAYGGTTYSTLSIEVPAGATVDMKNVDWRVYGLVNATADGSSINLTIIGHWQELVGKIAVGLGIQYWVRLVNPTPNAVTCAALKLFGKRYFVKLAASGAPSPEGEIVNLYPFVE